MPLIPRAIADLFKRRTPATPPPSRDQAAESKTALREFARMAVEHMGGRQQSEAAWIVDRNEFVRHVKGSAYIAIGCIARKCSMQAPEVLIRRPKKGDWEEEKAPLDHPLVKLFDRINAFHTLFDYIYYTVGWRLATGDSFAWKARNGLGVPSELWPLPSQWCYAIPSETEFISDYLVRGVWGKDTYWPAKDIIHISDPNLDWSGTGRYYGRPSMAAAGAYIDIEEAMLKRMLNWFKNYAPPGMIFSGAEGIGPDQIGQLYAIIAQQYAMSQGDGTPFVVPEGFKLESGAMATPKDIDYSAQLSVTLDNILAVHGVPKAVAGLSRDYNKANFQAAMLAFVQMTVNPLLKHMSQHHTQDLAHDFDEQLLVRFPECTVDDAEQMRKDYESAMKQGAATPNDVRQHLLELPPYQTGGDRPMVPGAWVEAPYGDIDEKLLADEKAEADAKEEAKRQEAAQRLEEMRAAQGQQQGENTTDGGEAGRGAKDGSEPGANGRPPSRPAKAKKSADELSDREQRIMDTVRILLERRGQCAERM